MPLPGLSVVKAQIAPYLWMIKAAILVAAFLFGLGVGCSHQKEHDRKAFEAMVSKKDAALGKAAGALEAAQQQLYIVARTLRAVDAATEAARLVGEQKVRDAKAAADLAKANERAARRRASAAQVELDRAKENPDCRKLLETKSCAAFH